LTFGTTLTHRKETMKTLTPLALGIFLATAPLAAAAADSMSSMNSMPSSGKLTVAATLKPAPAKQGTETITVTVKDSMGMPVKGAVVKIATGMPTMSMSGPTITAHPAGAGVYTAKANLNFATTWTFDVTAAAGKKTGKAHLSANVK
jgi:nitrogen fixation protein FixH